MGGGGISVEYTLIPTTLWCITRWWCNTGTWSWLREWGYEHLAWVMVSHEVCVEKGAIFLYPKNTGHCYQTFLYISRLFSGNYTMCIYYKLHMHTG